MVGKPLKKLTKRKSAKVRPGLLLLLLVAGAFGGWIAQDPANIDKAIEFTSEATADLPGTISKIPAALSSLPPPSQWGAAFSGIGVSIMRRYDAWIPQEYRDTLADGLPSVFAYPYLCKLTRIIPEAKAGGAPSAGPLAISARVSGVPTSLRVGALIRPGTELLGSESRTGASLECRQAKIELQPNSEMSFLRGQASQKVLALTGGMTLAAQGAGDFALSLRWGEVGLGVDGPATFLQVTGRPEKATVNIGQGQVLFTWEVLHTQNSNAEIFSIFGQPGTDVKVRRLQKGNLEMFPLGPKRQASFLASGQISGVAGGVRLDPSQLQAKASAGSAGAGGDSVSGDPAAMTGPARIQLVEAAINKRAQLVGNVVQADVLLEWRLVPTNRVVACAIDLAQDAQLQKVLARYTSNNMSLLIKGMRTGIYHWRAACDVDGENRASTVGKITITDGRAPSPLPVLVGPANNSAIRGASVDFMWNRAEGAQFYVLQLSRDAKFTKFNEYLAKQGTGLRMNLKVKGRYFWRVYGVTGSTKDKRTGFSQIWSFTF